MIRSSDKQFPPLQTSGMVKDTSQSITFTTHRYITLQYGFQLQQDGWEQEVTLVYSCTQARLWLHGCINLSEVLCWEHALGPSQDGIFGGVIRMLFWGNLQHGRDGLHVGIYSMTNHLCDELVDEDDANVTASQETPVNEQLMLIFK